jgi:hypothetical protein
MHAAWQRNPFVFTARFDPIAYEFIGQEDRSANHQNRRRRRFVVIRSLRQLRCLERNRYSVEVGIGRTHPSRRSQREF